jgi:hypothetical protein
LAHILLTLEIRLDHLGILNDFGIFRILTKSFPVSKEEVSWVADGECKEGNHDHGVINDQKVGFIIGGLRFNATGKLNDTIDIPDCDDDSGNAKGLKLVGPVSLVFRTNKKLTYPR